VGAGEAVAVSVGVTVRLSLTTWPMTVPCVAGAMAEAVKAAAFSVEIAALVAAAASLVSRASRSSADSSNIQQPLSTNGTISQKAMTR
jgi:hypothetical protein